jgi:hypothetical protein
MALQAGLYKSQDQQEQDLTQGPGWTIDDQKPSTFAGAATALPRGVGQGVSDGISVLTHGIHDELVPGLLDASPFGRLLRGADQDIVKAVPGVQTAESANEALEAMSQRTREFSKSLVGDPRTTGAGANVIQGFSKAVTEFTLGSLAGGPTSGAALLGATEGYAHYGDLLDLGVDEETAQRSGITTAMLSGGAAYLPMAMPAKWLAGLSAPTALAAQAGTGAVINTGFGAVDRYAGAKILRNAGYDAMADQQEVWDKTNVLADAISGAFFGAHSGWHGIKELAGKRIDPSLLDAAKVVQDRQAVINAAPGLPVDAKSAAVHRQAMQTAVGDMLTGKPVDLSEIDAAGAVFARGEVDESAATKIIRDAFVKSGVLDERDFNDSLDFLKGEKEEPVSQKPAEAPESVKPEAAAEPEGYDVGEGELTDEQRKAFGLGPLEEGAEASEPGSGGQEVHPGSDRSAEGIKVYRGSRAPLTDEHFSDDALGFASDKSAARLGVFFTADAAEAADHGDVSAHDLYLKNPKVLKTGELPAFDSPAEAIAYREKLKAEGHDGIVLDYRNVGGNLHYVAFSPDALKSASQLARQRVKTTGGPLAERPNLQIADEHGAPTSAADALDKATAEEAQANKEADPMMEAAVKCEMRHA